MHRCLDIAEIRRAISFELSYRDEDGKAPSASVLAALARTCRAFSEPALDFLWREQYTLAPLIQCMPSDLYSVDRNLNWNLVTFCRLLEDTDWTRFDFYSRKIHRLGGKTLYDDRSCTPTGVHKDVFCSLASYRPVKVLLPNLRIIELDDITLHTQILLGPSIHKVVINYIGVGGELLGTLFSSLARISPHIQELEILSEVDEEFLPALLKLICGLHDLRILSVESLGCSGQLTQHLGNLPSFKQLSDVQIVSDSIPFFTTSMGRFPCLETLAFKASDCSSCVTLLDRMHCSFTDLTIHTTEIGRSSAVKSLTECILHHSCMLSLTAIELYMPTFPLDPSADNGTYVSEIFSPLLSCIALKCVHLKSGDLEKLDDSWIMAASSAWPLLQELAIYSSSSLDGHPKMTLTGLIPLVKHCHQLQHLYLILDIKPIDSTQLNSVSNPLIHTLYLAHCSTISETGKVARSLIRMFPNLSTVNFPGRGAAEEGFKELNRLLAATA